MGKAENLQSKYCLQLQSQANVISPPAGAYYYIKSQTIKLEAERAKPTQPPLGNGTRATFHAKSAPNNSVCQSSWASSSKLLGTRTQLMEGPRDQVPHDGPAQVHAQLQKKLHARLLFLSFFLPPFLFFFPSFLHFSLPSFLSLGFFWGGAVVGKCSTTDLRPQP